MSAFMRGVDAYGQRVTVLKEFQRGGAVFCRVRFDDGEHEATVLRSTLTLDYESPCPTCGKMGWQCQCSSGYDGEEDRPDDDDDHIGRPERMESNGYGF